MVYKKEFNEMCANCGKDVLRDNHDEHIILTNGIEDYPYFCNCEDID